MLDEGGVGGPDFIKITSMISRRISLSFDSEMAVAWPRFHNQLVACVACKASLSVFEEYSQLVTGSLNESMQTTLKPPSNFV